jgi:hypothetical protein
MLALRGKGGEREHGYKYRDYDIQEGMTYACINDRPCPKREEKN